MIILGAVLLIAGFLLGIPLLDITGITILFIGAVLWIGGMAGHAVGGRRHYY